MNELAAVFNHTLLLHLRLGDLVHLRFKAGGHLGGGHLWHVLLEGLVHRHSGGGRLRRVIAHILAAVELLDDVRAGRLCAEPLLVHQLDQLGLGEPGRRLRFLVHQPRLAVKRKMLALFECRDLFVGGTGVYVDARVAGVEHYLAAYEVSLTSGFDVGPGGLGDHRPGEGREEATDDQLVDPRLGTVQGTRVKGVGRVYRRMGGVKFLALGWLQRRIEQRRSGSEILDLDQRGDRFFQRQRVGVDRVVGPRVRDEAVVVEVLGVVHGLLRRDPEAARSVDLKGVRVVRSRRLARVLATGNRLHHAGTGCAGHCCIGFGLVPEFIGGVVGLETGSIGMLELGEQLPEGL